MRESVFYVDVPIKLEIAEPLVTFADEFECRTIQWEAAKNYLTRKREDVYLDTVSIRYFANLPWVSGRND